MKSIRKILTYIITLMITFMLTNNASIISYADVNLGIGNKKIANIGVLLYSFNDLYMSKIKGSLEDIQKNNVNELNLKMLIRIGN